MAACQPGHAHGHAPQPDLRRCVRVRPAVDGCQEAVPGGPTAERKMVAVRPVASPDPGPPAGVHSLGWLPEKPGAVEAEPESPGHQGQPAERLHITAGPGDVRALRVAN